MCQPPGCPRLPVEHILCLAWPPHGFMQMPIFILSGLQKHPGRLSILIAEGSGSISIALESSSSAFPLFLVLEGEGGCTRAVVLGPIKASSDWILPLPQAPATADITNESHPPFLGS